MSEHAASMPGALLGASMLGVLGNADVTGRYGTERKSRQDPHENRCFSYAPDPVDNTKWSTADEWFKSFLDGLDRDPKRRQKLWRERVTIPVAVQLARDFEEKTEQLRRMIAVERERWLAESRA